MNALQGKVAVPDVNHLAGGAVTRFRFVVREFFRLIDADPIAGAEAGEKFAVARYGI
ncbi:MULTISPECIES: hypothetical protein [unclassified Neomoorella]|uniref:hypothetical protein n=1 Tax=unclassified Neomoorella TaxID=2676739 RepID=UPI00155B352D|nr:MULTISPECIES: hypothetical protein [unclassified Moorella (in: firmicutes)]